MKAYRYLATSLQTQDFEGSRDDHALLLVVRRRHSLEGLEPLESGLATLGLVRDHASHGPIEDLAGGAEVEGPTGGVDVATLAQELENKITWLDFFRGLNWMHLFAILDQFL